VARLFVKICGITRVRDADLAVELGATALGFIFWPGSPRYIAPNDAREVVQRLAAKVTTVGVFVNEPVELVREIMDVAGLDLAQLHGVESPEYCRQLRPAPIKAIALQNLQKTTNGGAPDLGAFDPDVLILLDAHDPARHGGTGRTIDWSAARQVAAARPTILSGGLNAGNVGVAIESVQPYGIDVSSGVESSPGVKDAARLRSFFEVLNG
jgi:phosphoribosylanthranilate isomerase